MVNKLLCIKCQKEIAEYKSLKGITTWFGICSECLFGVKGWTERDMKEAEKKMKLKNKEKPKANPWVDRRIQCEEKRG